jgi:hypothetical protein
MYVIFFWEGELKGRLQEVCVFPKGDNFPGRHFSFPGNVCLHQRDISALV